MLRTLKNHEGFTMIELFIVFAIISILAQIAFTFMIDLRSRSSDVTAIADGRNLMTVIRYNFINLDDVDYTKMNGSDVGVETTGGAPRPPVFTLSPGVQIRTIAGSSGTFGLGFFEVRLYHTDGTNMATPSGKKEFYYLASEQTGQYMLPTF